MLGVAHTLFENNLHNEEFLARYCVGFEKFCEYLTGKSDNTPKSADWASSICGIDAEEIRKLHFVWRIIERWSQSAGRLLGRNMGNTPIG